MNIEKSGTGIARWQISHTIAALLAVLVWTWNLTKGVLA